MTTEQNRKLRKAIGFENVYVDSSYSTAAVLFNENSNLSDPTIETLQNQIKQLEHRIKLLEDRNGP